MENENKKKDREKKGKCFKKYEIKNEFSALRKKYREKGTKKQREQHAEIWLGKNDVCTMQKKKKN